MSNIGNIWSQMYPPKPSFTEANLPDLAGKVYIVTGANTGVGKALSQLLYGKNAKVYVAARSREKAEAAIEDIKKAHPDSTGGLVFLQLDLADLSTIKTSAADFLTKERTLHVLFNNAGVMTPPQGSKTAQGYELQLGVNNLGTYLFTKLVTPALVATARASPASAVRVVWVSSSAAEHFSPKPHGVDLDNLDYHADKSPQHKYGISKAGNYLHAAAYARAHAADGIVSVALNPGNLDSDLARHRSGVERFVLKTFVVHPPVFGAYTELFAGLSPDVSLDSAREHNYWIVPWGRFAPLRDGLVAAGKTEKEGGTGIADKFAEWTEEQIKSYL